MINLTNYDCGNPKCSHKSTKYLVGQSYSCNYNKCTFIPCSLTICPKAYEHPYCLKGIKSIRQNLMRNHGKIIKKLEMEQIVNKRQINNCEEKGDIDDLLQQLRVYNLENEKLKKIIRDTTNNNDYEDDGNFKKSKRKNSGMTTIENAKKLKVRDPPKTPKRCFNREAVELLKKVYNNQESLKRQRTYVQEAIQIFNESYAKDVNDEPQFTV